jgi:hypothetical protein
VGPSFSSAVGLFVLARRRLRAALRQGLRALAMGWEDILGLAVTVLLLWYLLRSMLQAEKV